MKNTAIEASTKKIDKIINDKEQEKSNQSKLNLFTNENDNCNYEKVIQEHQYKILDNPQAKFYLKNELAKIELRKKRLEYNEDGPTEDSYYRFGLQSVRDKDYFIENNWGDEFYYFAIPHYAQGICDAHCEAFLENELKLLSKGDDLEQDVENELSIATSLVLLRELGIINHLKKELRYKGLKDSDKGKLLGNIIGKTSKKNNITITRSLDRLDDPNDPKTPLTKKSLKNVREILLKCNVEVGI
jgi:hypothetical protein